MPDTAGQRLETTDAKAGKWQKFQMLLSEMNTNAERTDT